MVDGSDSRFVVVVRVNTHCPLGCSYCGFSRDVHRARIAIEAPPLLRFAEALSDYQQRVGRRVLVSLLGGEPFLWHEWEMVSARLAELGLGLSATTNGLALENPRIEQQVLRHFDEITFSIDGTSLDHDALRAMPGMHRRLEAIVRGIALRRTNRKPLVRVNSVLTRTNIGNFEDFAHQMADWGVDQLTFNQLGGNDRPSFYADNRLLDAQVQTFRDAFPQWQSDLRDRGLELCGSATYLHRIACTTRNQAIPVDDCHPATEFLFVDESGRASPCSFTSAALGVSIEALTTADAIAALSQRWRHQRKHHRPTACDDCHANHVYHKFVPRVPVPSEELSA